MLGWPSKPIFSMSDSNKSMHVHYWLRWRILESECRSYSPAHVTLAETHELFQGRSRSAHALSLEALNSVAYRVQSQSL